MKPLLLFVGKTPSTTDVLNHIFSQRYRTATCATSIEVLDYLNANTGSERPAVILCDQATPDDTTPIEVFRALKNDHQHESIPLLTLSAHSEEETTDTALFELGWQEVIRKPFNPERVALTIREIVSSHP